MDTLLDELDLPVQRSSRAIGAEERQALMDRKAPFGSLFTDHMVVADYTEEKGWHGGAVVPFGPFEMHPASAVLHYGQAIFEGMKAYATPDGGVALFRPEMNARRFASSATRIAMPPLPEAMFLSALKALVRTESAWVPREHGSSLYLRPMMFARDPRLLTKPSCTYTFAVIASPVWEYFANGVAPVSVWISKNYIRAARGGTGEAKVAGNYAASFAAQAEAIAHGCEQVVWLDAFDRRTIEELGGMNLYFVVKDGASTKLVTPKAAGTLLKGVTRESLFTLAADMGYELEERAIDVAEWREGCRTGRITETFACGNIVFADADLEAAAAGVASGIFAAAGQTCIAGSRLLVQRDIYEAFLDKVCSLASNVKLGDPLDPDTQMGPLANLPQYKKVLGCIADAEGEGCKLALGGKPHADEKGGLFVQPTIFRDVDNRSQLAQREVFGPVLAVIPFDTEDEALRLANGTNFGLGAGLWTKDMSRVFRFAKGLQAGTVWVNTYRALSYMAPFGGVKASGLGRESGQEMIKAYMQNKTVWINNSTQPPGNPFVMRLG